MVVIGVAAWHIDPQAVGVADGIGTVFGLSQFQIRQRLTDGTGLDHALAVHDGKVIGICYRGCGQTLVLGHSLSLAICAGHIDDGAGKGPAGVGKTAAMCALIGSLACIAMLGVVAWLLYQNWELVKDF